MNTTTRSSTAERFGHKLGRTWRAYLHYERRVVAWLISVGAPSAVATALVWVVTLAVLGILLYAAFWLALLLLFAVAAAWMAGHGDATEEKMGYLPPRKISERHRGTIRCPTTMLTTQTFPMKRTFERQAT